MNKNTLKGVITHITEEVVIPRAEGKDFRKVVVSIETSDGQLLFPEILNHRIESFNRAHYITGESVEIGFFFRGQENNGKRYNNIHLETIKRI